jgi:hypothetical protein
MSLHIAMKNCPHCENVLALHAPKNARSPRGISQYLNRIQLIKLPLICAQCKSPYIPRQIKTTGKSANKFCSIRCRQAYRI